MVAISLSPNTESDDSILAIKTLLQPWKWKTGREIEKVEEWFRKEFNTDTAVSFNSGRSALWALLKAFSIGQGDEVLVQAFTCVAVPEVVMWVGATPVYCDIDDTYNIDPNDIEKKITKKTKAIIVQHTFGIPARIREIREIGNKYNLIVIED
ncbi:DegT/DnrJ/EryC1/StrS aminotransferase family protein, partial [Candidatus Roizmanbacteria bacterium]|nr:DegT/DnrJ/EryC1/StrS aminotransferase family protein [Candidatus Roizmanbacteria bacterium]